MKCAVEMLSDGVMYIPSFLKICSGSQGHYHNDWQAALLVLLKGGICEVHGWDGIRWRDVHKTIHDDRFRHSSNIKGTTLTIREGFVEYAVEVA
jgi:hypothetical protein